ncbi:MAG: SusC/RagA family TonB-linked outer membrane protein [Chitinophagaceae bacterium]
MKHLFFAIRLVALLCMISPAAFAQGLVNGKVTSQQGEPLSGVNVTVKGTTTGARTDAGGSFSIAVQKGQVLNFSFVGYEPAELTYEGQTSLSLQLKVAYGTLEEVVAIGYGAVTKKEVTGSVVTVKARDFNKGDMSNPMGLIQGKVPGLTVTKAGGGDPNAGYQIQLRGLNTLSAGKSPLIIVDGVMDANIAMLDPNQIESIDVLKDGSAAAIYGTRATNGVILITTKRADIGDVKYEINAFVSTEKIAEDNRYLSGDEYRQAIKDYYPTRTYLDKGQSTDWMDQVTQSPISQNYSFSASGGTRKINFRANLYYKSDQGIVKNSGNQTITPSLFISQTGLNDRLKIDYRLMYSMIKRKFGNYGALGQATWRNPTEPVYDPADIAHAGYYTVTTSSGYLNPVAMIDNETNDREDANMIGDINASYRLIDDLRLILHGSYNSFRSYGGTYKTKYYPEVGTNGYATVASNFNSNYVFEPGFEYKKKFNDHSLQVIGGYSYYENQNNSLSDYNYNFDLDDFSYYNIGSGYALTSGLAGMTTNKSLNKLIAFYGRVIYNFREKYLLSASLRHEGSSRFGQNHKWGNFPAVSLGWRINEEDFIKKQGWISNLKLRVGYGVTGNQDISNYLSLSRISVSPRQFYYAGSWINAYRPASNPNPDLKWEKKAEYNAGLDFGLFNNRIYGSIDYYVRKISDLLWSYAVPVPPNVYNSTYANVGTMQNKGIEISLNGDIIRSNDLTLSATVNYTRNRNKLLSFSDPSRGYTLQYLKINPAATTWTQLVLEDKPLGNFMAPVFLGVDASGNAIYEDVDKSGAVNVESELDRRVVGNAYPKFELGWSTSLQYKNFDLSFFFRGVFGQSLLNYERVFYENWQPFLSGRNILRSTLTNTPKYTGITTYDSRFIEKASFVKLNNVSIGYTVRLPKGNTIHFFATGQNLLTITDYSGSDPEAVINDFNLNTATAGTENLSYYPFTRTYTIGFNYKF